MSHHLVRVLVPGTSYKSCLERYLYLCTRYPPAASHVVLSVVTILPVVLFELLYRRMFINTGVLVLATVR